MACILWADPDITFCVDFTENVIFFFFWFLLLFLLFFLGGGGGGGGGRGIGNDGSRNGRSLKKLNISKIYIALHFYWLKIFYGCSLNKGHTKF